MKKIAVSHLSILAILASLLLGSGRLMASEPIYLPESVNFHPHELSIDAFGYTAGRDKSANDEEAFGYGVAVNYFFTDKIGAWGEMYTDAFTAPYLLNFSGVFRYPFPEFNTAPYAFVGLGRQWEHAPQWIFHLGGGAEYRLKEWIGGFADLRGVFPVDNDPYVMFRVGIRFIIR